MQLFHNMQTKNDYRYHKTANRLGHHFQQNIETQPSKDKIMYNLHGTFLYLRQIQTEIPTIVDDNYADTLYKLTQASYLMYCYTSNSDHIY